MGTHLHLSCETRLSVQREEVAPDGLPIIGPDQKSVLSMNDDLGDASDVRGDDGVPEIHGFEQGIGQPLVV